MKFGLFQSYRHISNLQERQQIIMSDKDIDIIEKLSNLRKVEKVSILIIIF